jgi:hypothetical protein
VVVRTGISRHEKSSASKAEAGLALQTLALTGGLGLTADTAAIRMLAHYRRKVRANRRRLARAEPRASQLCLLRAAEF